jgi:hypothetical protein
MPDSTNIAASHPIPTLPHTAVLCISHQLAKISRITDSPCGAPFRNLAAMWQERHLFMRSSDVLSYRLRFAAGYDVTLSGIVVATQPLGNV